MLITQEHATTVERIDRSDASIPATPKLQAGADKSRAAESPQPVKLRDLRCFVGNIDYPQNSEY